MDSKQVASVLMPVVLLTAGACGQPQHPLSPSGARSREMLFSLGRGWDAPVDPSGLVLRPDHTGVAVVTQNSNPGALKWHEAQVLASAPLRSWTVNASDGLAHAGTKGAINYAVTQMALDDNRTCNVATFLEVSWQVQADDGDRAATLLWPLSLDDARPVRAWAEQLEGGPFVSQVWDSSTPRGRCFMGCNGSYDVCVAAAKNTYDRKHALCYAGGAAGAGATAACGPFFLICLLPVAGLLDMCLLDVASDLDLQIAACNDARTACIGACP